MKIIKLPLIIIFLSFSSLVKAEINLSQVDEREVVEPDKLQTLQQRLQLLKHELEIKKHMGEDNKNLKVLDQKIKLIDQKLHSYVTMADIGSAASIGTEKPASEKHSLILGELPKQAEVGLEKELPLPPPPKMAS